MKWLEYGERVVALVLYLFVMPLILLAIAGLYEDIKITRGDEAQIVAETSEEATAIIGEYANMVAWIRVDDTAINYPVMQTNNNSWFLTRDYTGNFSAAGSLFLDFRNDFETDDVLLIYGHSMSGDKMFAGISKFGDKGYFESHYSGVLIGKGKEYDIDFFAYAVIGIETEEVYEIGDYRVGKNDEILNKIRERASIWRDNAVDEGRIVILSTCDKGQRNLRDVLVGALREKV